MVDTKVWAHRGASGYMPENTLESFRLAIEQGADGIELDVQLTKDGEIVVIHDETIDRVCDGSGYVRDYTLAQLREFNFNKTHPECAECKIPTLKEVYELFRDNDMIINVEIKTGIIFYEDIEKKVLDLTKEMNMKDRVIYSSFNHYTIKKIQELDAEAVTGLLYCDGIIDMPDYCIRHGATALHPALYNLQFEGFIKECRDKNIKLHVWTVNEEKYMRMLCDNNIDAIITNYPDVAKKVVESYGK